MKDVLAIFGSIILILNFPEIFTTEESEIDLIRLYGMTILGTMFILTSIILVQIDKKIK